ncbi:MAG: hypothetical protein ACREJ2_11105 [Planctomycetota bacterium]
MKFLDRRRWFSAVAILLVAGGFASLPGCLEQDVSAVKTGKEFMIEQTLVSVRKDIVQWQTDPKNSDTPLPDSLADIPTVESDIRNADDGMYDGYYFRFFKSDDGNHYVLYAYPKQKGINGISSYFLADMGASKSREFSDDFDQTQWDYTSLVDEFSKGQ